MSTASITKLNRNINGFRDLSLNEKQSELLLASVIIARASAYMFQKILLTEIGQFSLLAERQLLAFFVLLVIFRKRVAKANAKQIKYGLILGVCFFTLMSFELAALRYTSSISVAFEENTAIVWVPIICMIMNRKLPSKKTTAGFSAAMIGVILMGFEPSGFEFNRGDLFGILAAISYAVTIVMTSKLSAKEDPITMGIFEVGFMGLIALVCAIIFEVSPLLQLDGADALLGVQGATQISAVASMPQIIGCISRALPLPKTLGHLFCLLALALICSVYGITLQPLAQRGISAEKAGSMCALNPVISCILGYLFLNEMLTLRSVLGATLIIASIVL